MSKRAEALVWDRSRAGKSDLLMLVKIADVCDDDGRNCWAEVPKLAIWCRATVRGAQYILHRLERAGEIVIDYNDDGRDIVLRGGRTFCPKWFIHVRCVCEWEAYQAEGEDSEILADSEDGFRRGRPRRKPKTEPAKIAHLARDNKSQSFQPNANGRSQEMRKITFPYKEDPSVDPLIEQEQGLRPDRHPPKPDEPDDNVSVIAKLAHELLVRFPRAELGDLTEGLKERCAKLHIAYDSDAVRKAIDSAIWQRRRKASGA